MNYTQSLRGLNVLKWVAIVFAGLYVFIVVVAGANGAFAVHPAPRDVDGGIPLPALFAISAFVAAVVGSVLARSLSTENETHTPVVWTLPLSRVRYALTMIATDALTILAAFLITFALAIAFAATFRAVPLIEVTPDTTMQLLRFLIWPFAMYGLVLAITASTAKGGRALAGWTWVGCVIIGTLTALGLPRPWGTIFKALDTINPLAYASYTHGSGGDVVNVMGGPGQATFANLPLTTDISALCAIFAVGLIAGILQWRRVEV